MKTLAVLFVGLLFLANTVQAVQPADIVIPIPRSKIVREKSPETELSDFGIQTSLSNWTPANYQGDAYVSGATGFVSTRVPTVQVNFENNLWHLSKVDISGILGVRFAQVERVGSLRMNGTALAVSQDAYFYSLPAGFLVKAAQSSFGIVKPFVSAALLPTSIQAATTALAKNINKFELGAAESVGVQFGFSAGNMNLGWIWTQSQDSDCALCGQGVQLGFEIYL